MDDKQAGVTYLKKVALQMESGMSADHMDLTDGPMDYAFIYGVATDGITLFEKELFAKQVDDEVVCHVHKETAAEFLGHLRQPILSRLPAATSFFLKARITDIQPAENREVIQAIASSTGDCGADCDCGCGCGCS